MRSGYKNGTPAPRIFFLWCLLLTIATTAVAKDLTLNQVQRVFPAAQSITALNGQVPAYMVRSESGQLGYVFTTAELAPISAYSGKPINTLIGLGEDGLIRGLDILHHEEPILVIGISDADLAAFVGQFAGRKVTDRIRVGAHGREGYVGIDGISGATITTMVLTSSVNKAMHLVAQTYGIPRSQAPAMPGLDAPTAQPEFAEVPAWHRLWQERQLELALVALALLLLLFILFFQDWLVEHTVLFHRLRVGYLLFTVFLSAFIVRPSCL